MAFVRSALGPRGNGTRARFQGQMVRAFLEMILFFSERAGVPRFVRAFATAVGGAVPAAMLQMH
eukprot:488804-Prorocentrum_lima.AAC.1